MSASNGYTAARLAELTGIEADQLRELERLGVITAEASGSYPDEAVDRIELVQYALRRGVAPDVIERFCHDQVELFDLLLDTRVHRGPAYTLDDAIAFAAAHGVDDTLLAELFDLLGPEPGQSLTDEDLAALRMANEAIDVGFPREALLQLIRVMTEAAERVAEAENRVFHDYVHERHRAGGLAGQELIEATQALSKPLLDMAEPALVYLHRRALHRAMREDFVRHVTEDSRPPLERPGEAPTTMLFIDLAGFTPLTVTMGDDAAADVLARFASIVRSATARRHGRIVKQIGDAFMLVFDDPTEALRFGVDVTRDVNAQTHFPPVHIGAHHGSVLYRDGDYVGATVNLAARVASATAAGQFLVTDAVRRAVSDERDLEFSQLPPATLKGLDTPVTVFEVRTHADEELPRDPICGMRIRPGQESARATYAGTDYLFCSRTCHEKFQASPDLFTRPGSANTAR